MKKQAIIFISLAFLSVIIADHVTGQSILTIKDQDGNSYKIVKIGNQTWMSENLKTTKYNDGVPIPLVTEKNKWSLLSTPAYCWYNNDSLNMNLYGALYNGFAVNIDKLCPAGWHVSTVAEWAALIDQSGGKSVAGGKLKASGTTTWKNPNTGATNESGFTALPRGTRYNNGLFFTIKTDGYWWTSSKVNSLNGWYWSINHQSVITSVNYGDLTNGFSVRCVMD